MNRVSAVWRSGVAVAALALTGCAGLSAPAAPPFRDPALSMPSAQALVTPGKSTRSDVIAALGSATVVTFDSGFEVWAYRTKPPGANTSASTELIVLIGPSGVVRKTRLRINP